MMEMDMRLTVSKLPSRHPMFTFYFPSYAKFSLKRQFSLARNQSIRADLCSSVLAPAACNSNPANINAAQITYAVPTSQSE